MAGMRDIAERLAMKPVELARRITTIVHGTTVATNALLTLRGAKTALITTKGFRDALEMRRGRREEQYNNHYRNVIPLVPRYLRFGVEERIDSKGGIVTPLREEELLTVTESLEAGKIESIAVCFLNAYQNSIHEEQTAEFLRKRLPSCFITASTEVLPSIRFYERLSTTVVNAYIGPIVAIYVDNLLKKLHESGFNGSLLIMQSNGGVVTPEYAKSTPASTVLSGPAAAPTAGAFYAQLMGYKDCITIDMGGTSFDASLVIEGKSVTSTEGSINRHRIALPALDIATIGAGGGSIGWIDSGGLLQMGPQSAGALPGPICYGRGGDLPTCTDADLILGYLNADYFAGGKIKLDAENAERIIEEQLAPKLGLSKRETAVGMYRIINMNMAQGVRMVSVERGYDPREFLFLVAGGAGAIHAGEICRELEIPLFVVPNVASTLCAAGMLLGDLKHDYVRSHLAIFSSLDQERVIQLLYEMKDSGVEALLSEGVPEHRIQLHPALDLRYLGQYHEVQLAVSWEDILSHNLEYIRSAFHLEHNRLFGYSLEEEGTEIEMINVRLRVIGLTEKPSFLGETVKSVSLEAALKPERPVFIPELNDFQRTPVYSGDMPLNGLTIRGPAVIEKTDTSIFISSSYDCFVDEYGSYLVYDRRIFPNGPRENSTKLGEKR